MENYNYRIIKYGQELDNYRYMINKNKNRDNINYIKLALGQK